MTKTNQFDRLASQYELPGQIIMLFGQLHGLDKSTATSVHRQLGDLLGVSGAPPGQGKNGQRKRLTNWDRLTAHALANGNPWMKKEGMKQQLGFNDWAVHAVLYGDRRDCFEHQDNYQGGKASAYRLTKAALLEARQEGGAP